MQLIVIAENDQTETEKLTGTVRGVIEKNQGREIENSENNGNLEKRVMTDQGRESERDPTEGIVTKQKKERGIEQGKEKSLKMATEEVVAGIDHLTAGRAGSRDILKIIPQR